MLTLSGEICGEVRSIIKDNMKTQKNKRKKTAKDRILDILLILFIAIALGSGAYLGRYYYISHKTQKGVETLRDMVDDTAAEDEKVTVAVSPSDAGAAEHRSILKKYEKIYESNSEFMGWISIDGTVIDYPVMYTPDDPEKYLHLDFDGEWSLPGIPFIDSRCNPLDDRTDNMLIYGHNMQSGIMFHSLLEYENEEYYKEHRYIKFDTLYESSTYEIIGALRTQIYPEDDTEHLHYNDFIDASDKDEFDEYVDFVKQNTPYDTGVTAEYGDALITLSTCAYHVTQGRFIVVAKKIK